MYRGLRMLGLYYNLFLRKFYFLTLIFSIIAIIISSIIINIIITII